MSTVDDAIESGALALAEMATAPAAEAIRAAWPLLSDGLRELHPAQWECGNPRHTNPEVGCPECSEVCATCDRTMPCPTVRELDRIDKEMGL